MQSDLPLTVRFDVPTGSLPADSPLLLHRLDQVLPRLSHLTSLEIGPVPGSRFLKVDICMLFQERMPVLRELTLRATYAVDRHGRAVVEHVPQPALQSDNLPRLRSLVLDGVGLPSTGVLGYGLRRLELKNYPSEECQTPFPQLLAALAFSGALEELHIHNYLKVANLESINSRPFILANLTRLVIHDSPPHIAHLLPFLHVPQAVQVLLSSYFPKFMIDGARVIPALHTLFPPSNHALDIPSLRPNAVAVFITSADVVVTGIATGGLTRVEGLANLSDPSTRVQTYARTVESLGSIYSIADVTTLVITGEFSSSLANIGMYVYDTTVTSAKPPSNNGTMYPFGSHNKSPSSVVPTSRPLVPNWLAVLSQFPALTSLHIADKGGAIPPESFAIALAGTPTLVCCPHLKELHLEGVIYDQPFFDRLAESLAVRGERRMRLRELTITMSTPARRSITEEVEYTFQDCVDSIDVCYG
ncbi:hypothetical protein C8T65DRAFT_734263 [Cerioporus squamosus]|nr:hypothetical protein C8T65DRAFT_734263 [Cerioporus squamosus]